MMAEWHRSAINDDLANTLKSTTTKSLWHQSWWLARGLFTETRETIMKLLKAIIRPNKLEEVKDALTALNVTGMTVTEVRGHGRQKGHKAVYRGTEYSVTLLPKIMIELVLTDDRVEDTLKAIIATARTGEIGDGRVFILPVDHGYNIRTGERDTN